MICPKCGSFMHPHCGPTAEDDDYFCPRCYHIASDFFHSRALEKEQEEREQLDHLLRKYGYPKYPY